MSNNGIRTTICITTLDRPGYLERTLEYYRRAGFAGVLLVGDGSKGEYADANDKIVQRYRDSLRVERIDTAHLSQPATMSLLADRVTTDYAAYSGDDDYLIPAAIAECERFLDGHPDYVSAHGIGTVLNMDGVHGVPFQAEWYRLPVVLADDPLVRLETFFRHYAVAIWGVHRRAAWREMFRLTRHMTDKAIGAEIAPCAISAVLGKTMELGIVYLARQIHSKRYALPAQIDWLLQPEFSQSCRLLLLQLAETVRTVSPAYADHKDVESRIWDALMWYLFPRPGDRYWAENASPDPALAPEFSVHRAGFDDLEYLINGDMPAKAQFDHVMASLLGKPVLDGAKPRLLLSWGNPYVLDEAITPILPALASHFQIVLLLVDYKLSQRVKEEAYAWKDEGLVVDVLIAPSHGGSLNAHLYIWYLLPIFRKLDFSVFLSISAMQPYERYIIDCMLPEKCVRVLFWPHPTNLFVYPELGQAVYENRGRSEINRIIASLRRRIEPSIFRELIRPAPGMLRIWLFLAVISMFKAALGAYRLLARAIEPIKKGVARRLALRKTARALPNAGGGTSGSKAGRISGIAPMAIETGLSLLRRIARAMPWVLPVREVMLRYVPLLVYLIQGGMRRGWRMAVRLKNRLESVRVLLLRWRRGHLSLRPSDWPVLGKLNFSQLEQHYYHTLDRLVYPLVLVRRTFPFKKLDYITQIGTDQFDACLFFNDLDTRLHKILFDNPNMHTVRYVPRNATPVVDPVNAVLMPFGLHSQNDLTPALLEIYRRDLSIALKESGAAEVHIRPHPGLPDDWLGDLVTKLRGHNVPCKLVSNTRPLSEEAARYRGVIGVISGSLRDARLACPHIFVTGSVGLSATHFSNPKMVVGFPESIGWIEADGSYDPRIFRPASENASQYPTVAEAVIDLFERSKAKSGQQSAARHAPGVA